MTGMIAASILAATAATGSLPAVAESDNERGARNYQQVLSGAKPLSHLTREEVWELIRLDRYLRDRYLDRRSPRERCLDDELARLQAPPTYLALRSIDLKCSQR